MREEVLIVGSRIRPNFVSCLPSLIINFVINQIKSKSTTKHILSNPITFNSIHLLYFILFEYLNLKYLIHVNKEV